MYSSLDADIIFAVFEILKILLICDFSLKDWIIAHECTNQINKSVKFLQFFIKIDKKMKIDKIYNKSKHIINNSPMIPSTL